MSDQDLKKKILQGGIVLAIRQLITSVFSLVSVLVVARVLGPEKYGIVAIAMGIFYFLIWTNKLGIGVYVLRQTELPKRNPPADPGVLQHPRHGSSAPALAACARPGRLDKKYSCHPDHSLSGLATVARAAR
ncbi:MAG: oligosaccharide flippase family protein [Synechococcales cyanobacterium RU_4_20]|nr:oligosaccharide flippase family protein [Synechococcales cyanobacterium RU_4_20]